MRKEQATVKQVLITGANFHNKGAQSMLFVTVDEVMRRFPHAKIVFQTNEIIQMSVYQFDSIAIDWKVIEGGWRYKLSRYIIDIIKYITGDKSVKRKYEGIKVLPHSDIIIDISGYAIGSQWSEAHNESYIYKLLYAKRKHIPFYMMPQSIGTFQFENKIREKKAHQLRKAFSEVLKYPEIIYVREEEGIKNLEGIGISNNVHLSADLVLQNKGISISNIFKIKPKLNLITITGKPNVALVPNAQNIIHGSREDVVDIYSMVIRHLIRIGKNIYIISHSNVDIDLCMELFERANDKHVRLVKDDLSCLEYDYLVKQFDYVIGSRYHGIVHALRNDIPCVALGWAVKYRAMMELVGLDMFVFDITREAGVSKIISSIDELDSNLELYRDRISRRVKLIQKENCFAILDALV